MAGVHDPYLVILSIAIAVCASFTALSLAGRLRVATGLGRRVWAGAAAVALGGGIWSMHFIAMLAFSMPGMPMSYDLGLTMLSLAIALGFTGGGFGLMAAGSQAGSRVVGPGLLIGLGVLAMHYVGMAAMRMPATLSYDPVWVAVSVAIAVGAAVGAVQLASRDHQPLRRLAASVLMGAAIAGMHYAGMRAAVFHAHAGLPGAVEDAGLGQGYLAALVATITVLILLSALGAARLERLFDGFARREARIALRLQVADVLRGQATAQALHEVAELMGRHFGATRTGYGQLDPQEDVFDYDICWTDGSVPPLIGRFPAAAFGIKIVAALKAGDTVAIDDLFASPMSDEAQTQDTAREVDTRAILVVPFVRDGRLQTIVYLNDRKPRRWHPQDVAFMEEIAERTRLVIEREAVEQQLRELNATLEARVEQRTEELRQTQEALLQSQKMEAVGQLVSGLAHDFNNVLGAIVGAFEVARRRADNPDAVRKFAEAGIQAAERGAKLTAQLLAFSRSQRIQLQPLIVCDVIEAIRDLLDRTLGPMIRLELKLNPAPVPVMADATQVEMMILNLAINARDAMPDGGTLTISTALRTMQGDGELADGPFVEIEVRDTGTGMDEETLRRAMEPFFTTKPVGKGTGLGLAQIYGSARQTGGTVRIQSREGEGTAVKVFLPCTDQQPVRPAATSSAIDERVAAGEKVLLIDDDADLRGMLAAALEQHGYRVFQAGDGPSGLALLDAEPDVAVLDFAMPDMNGVEVARRIRALRPGLRLIFASGFADTDAIHAVAGPDAIVLRKPFRVDELLRVIARPGASGSD
jgi:NO-binding membrane sensor protein with MHYT domain/nitrogen-specific signal transduction histidine kinase